MLRNKRERRIIACRKNRAKEGSVRGGNMFQHISIAKIITTLE